jgi:aldose 1-epimerase
MMLLQASGRIPDLGEVDLIHAPPLRDAAAQLDARGPDDFAGNLTFRFGGGILLPYANRIRGES